MSRPSYYAALRRYLALIGIEQGDATDRRPVARRCAARAWAHWFGEREVARAVGGKPGARLARQSAREGWRAASRRWLAPDRARTTDVGAAVADAACATLVGIAGVARDGRAPHGRRGDRAASPTSPRSCASGGCATRQRAAAVRDAPRTGPMTRRCSAPTTRHRRPHDRRQRCRRRVPRTPCRGHAHRPRTAGGTCWPGS